MKTTGNFCLSSFSSLSFDHLLRIGKLDHSFLSHILLIYPLILNGIKTNKMFAHYVGNGKKSKENRPPLASIVAQEQNPKQKYAPREGFFFSPRCLNEDSTKTFELMNIKIVVYAVSGIMCENELLSRKRFGKSSKNTSKKIEGGTSKAKGLSGSTISSIDMSTSDDEAFVKSEGAVTTAVVSFEKDASGIRPPLEMFIPSLPLNSPTSSLNANSQFSASWPSAQSSLANESAIERSSFNLTRHMQQGTYVPGAGIASNYVHQALELRISLCRGTELIRLGTASLVITGEEEGEVQMKITTTPILHRNKKRNGGILKSNVKSNKYGYFSTDLTRRYYLDKNAMVTVGVQAIPQNTLKFAEEIVKKESEMKHRLEETNHARHHVMGMRQENFGTNYNSILKQSDLSKIKAEIAQRKENCPQTPHRGFSPSFLCDSMLCTPVSPSKAVIAETPRIPFEISHTNTDSNQFGVASMVSSVSASTDGSYYYSDDVSWV